MGWVMIAVFLLLHYIIGASTDPRLPASAYVRSLEGIGAVRRAITGRAIVARSGCA
jgi:hypothetical protein